MSEKSQQEKDLLKEVNLTLNKIVSEDIKRLKEIILSRWIEDDSTDEFLFRTNKFNLNRIITHFLPGVIQCFPFLKWVSINEPQPGKFWFRFYTQDDEPDLTKYRSAFHLSEEHGVRAPIELPRYDYNERKDTQ